MNFDNWKCRSSALGNIMSAGKSLITDKQMEEIKRLQEKANGGKKLTDKQTQDLAKLIRKRDNPELSTTCKSYLIECYVTERYGRQKDVYSKYMEKGIAVEEDAITLYSLVKGEFFKKNEENLSNEWITGCPDIREFKHVRDIKSSWDIFTFFNSKLSKINLDYEWQLTGYTWLDAADSATLVYCLVDTPEGLIHKASKQLMWDMNAATDESPEFLKAKDELERSMRFSDIPRAERVHEKLVYRSDTKINQIPDRVKECREWLNELHTSLTEKAKSLQEVEF
jgi:hypothetical protein